MVSINTVFAKVKSDLGINDNAVEISNWVEWTSEALKKIGAFPQFVTRVTGVRDHYGYNDVLTVEDWETEVPCDCYRILQVAFSANKSQGYQPARTKTGFMDIRNQDISLSNKKSGDYTPFPNVMQDKIQFTKDVFNESWAEAAVRLGTDANLNKVLDMAFNTDGTLMAKGLILEYLYEFNDPYLRCSMQNGYAIVAYQAIPTDEFGYPLIPDDVDLHEAIFWYINMKERYKDYLRHHEGAKDIYEDAKYEWKSKKMACYGNMMMPKGVDDIRSIQNIWLRMIPKINEHYTGYKNIGAIEKLYNRQ